MSWTKWSRNAPAGKPRGCPYSGEWKCTGKVRFGNFLYQYEPPNDYVPPMPEEGTPLTLVFEESIRIVRRFSGKKRIEGNTHAGHSGEALQNKEL